MCIGEQETEYKTARAEARARNRALKRAIARTSPTATMPEKARPRTRDRWAANAVAAPIPRAGGLVIVVVWVERTPPWLDPHRGLIEPVLHSVTLNERSSWLMAR